MSIVEDLGLRPFWNDRRVVYAPDQVIVRWGPLTLTGFVNDEFVAVDEIGFEVDDAADPLLEWKRWRERFPEGGAMWSR